MAVDVHEALAGIVAKEGSISREKAEEYLQNLSDSKRYLRDVY
jgi:sulfite reductase (NADPH) flavoprotein alpha-component